MPLTPWRQVPIEDNQESLVRLTGLFSTPWHQQVGRAGALNEVWLRLGTARKLFEAQTYLPKGVKLMVLDGWRSTEFHSKVVEADVLEIFERPELEEIIDPRDTSPLHPAPSLTGGRVGVTLCDDEGTPLDMGSVVRRPCPQASTYFFHDKRSESSKLLHGRRMCLLVAMTRSGFSSDNGAWWRFQYGTQQHHALVGGPAQYGLVEQLPGGHQLHAYS